MRRRRLLRTIGSIGSIGAITTLGVGAGTVAAGECDETVMAGESIQDAVDEADPGDTICVEPGTYEETVTIETEDLTLRSTERWGATIDGDGATATVEILADGVTLYGFRIENPEGLLGIRADAVEDVTILHNYVTNVGPYGSLGTTGILVTEPSSNVSIVGNRLSDITAEGDQETAHFIFFDDVEGEDGGVSDSVIANNVMTGLSSRWGAMGVLFNADLSNVEVRCNRIRDVTSDGSGNSNWSHGITVSDTQSDVTVTKNDIRNIVSSTEDDLWPGTAIKVEPSATPANMTIERNNLVAPEGLENENEDTVVATDNWWGHPSGPEHEDNPDGQGSAINENPGEIEYEPWLKKPVDQKKCDSGETKKSKAGDWNSIPGTIERKKIDLIPLCYTEEKAYFRVDSRYKKTVELRRERFGIGPAGSFTVEPDRSTFFSVDAEDGITTLVLYEGDDVVDARAGHSWKECDNNTT